MTEAYRCPIQRRRNGAPTDCGRPLDGTAYACHDCAQHLAEQLTTAARYVGEWETTITRQDATGEPGKTSRDTPLPFAWDAADAGWAATNTVTTWARHIADTRGIRLVFTGEHVTGPLCRAGWGCRHASCEAIRTRRTADPLAALMRWLAGQTEWLRHRPEATEACDELADACRLAERTIDRSSPRWYAGRCGATTDHGTCDTDLYAPTGADTIPCPACGAVYDADSTRDRLLNAADDRLVHPEWMARALTQLGVPCTAATVRGLAYRGRIQPHGRDDRDRPLYRVSEVRDALNKIETARQEAARRRTELADRRAARQLREAV